MFDLTTPRGKIIDAALRLAAAKPWREVTLMEIAHEAGVSLADLAKEFYGKLAIVGAFQRLVDDEVLRRAEAHKDVKARDRVFDVVMTRFEVMAPHRVALRSIVADGGVPPLPATIKKMMRSQHWMLVAAGIPADGPAGRVREAGLLTVYARAFREWLDDEDPGHAKTMAVLDRRLRNGERWMQFFEDAHERAERFASAFRPGARWSSRKRSEPAGAAPASTPPPNEATF